MTFAYMPADIIAILATQPLDAHGLPTQTLNALLRERDRAPVPQGENYYLVAADRTYVWPIREDAIHYLRHGSTVCFPSQRLPQPSDLDAEDAKEIGDDTGWAGPSPEGLTFLLDPIDPFSAMRGLTDAQREEIHRLPIGDQYTLAGLLSPDASVYREWQQRIMDVLDQPLTRITSIDLDMPLFPGDGHAPYGEGYTKARQRRDRGITISATPWSLEQQGQPTTPEEPPSLVILDQISAGPFKDPTPEDYQRLNGILDQMEHKDTEWDGPLSSLAAIAVNKALATPPTDALPAAGFDMRINEETGFHYLERRRDASGNVIPSTDGVSIHDFLIDRTCTPLDMLRKRTGRPEGQEDKDDNA